MMRANPTTSLTLVDLFGERSDTGAVDKRLAFPPQQTLNLPNQRRGSQYLPMILGVFALVAIGIGLLIRWPSSGLSATDATVRLRRLEEGHQICCFRGHSQRVNAVRFTADDQSLLSASDDVTVRIGSVAPTKLP